ncbi:hypothetical protein B0I37DRAFT_371818 [Chaetomium sp. MPI-CAGE-AT-0009]|nr:hypothetical protein B0I37DRAFT_371818 [Chaetomium sp. MPI-CAGE-AT-0009]
MLSSAAGACYIYGGRFTCGGGAQGAEFGVSVFSFLSFVSFRWVWFGLVWFAGGGVVLTSGGAQIWPFPNSVPGKDCLRYGQYGLMASSGQGGPPAVGDAPLEVHFVSYSEQGKYVWLTWAAV